MLSTFYHAILVDVSFDDPEFVNTFSCLARKQEEDWAELCVNINPQNIEEAITQIQIAMKVGKPFYNHIYGDNEIIVIFKERVFKALLNKSDWKPIIEYGLSLDIPEKQLIFSPNTLIDERDYFKLE